MLQYPVNLLSMLLSILVTIFVEFKIAEAIRLFTGNLFLEIVLSIVIAGIICIVLVYLLQLIMVLISGQPCSEFLVTMKNIKGSSYYIALNPLGFLNYALKNNQQKIKLMMDLRESLFNVIKKLNLSKVKADAEFTLDTWILLERDKKFLESMGFTFEKDNKPPVRITLQLIYYLVTGHLPSADFQWHRIRFDKKVAQHIQANYITYNDFYIARRKFATQKD